jgi:hypothetical protein
VTLPGTQTGPEAAAVDFALSTVRDLDALFERCRPSFQHEYPKWTKSPWPDDWKAAFVLDGLGVNGDGLRDVCYFVKPANHYFTASFENGAVTGVVVDG